MDILKKKTQDQTGFLSNMSIGMIQHEETKSPRHGNPSEEGNKTGIGILYSRGNLVKTLNPPSPKGFMHPSSLDYINIQNDQSCKAFFIIFSARKREFFRSNQA